jgi:hypothetical protein
VWKLFKKKTRKNQNNGFIYTKKKSFVTNSITSKQIVACISQEKGFCCFWESILSISLFRDFCVMTIIENEVDEKGRIE